MSAALLLLAAALAPAAPNAERQSVEGVEILAEGAPMAARAVDRRDSFYSQRVILETGLVLDIPPAALTALRRQYRLDERRHFVLSEWLSLGTAAAPALRRLAFLYCSSRVSWGTRATCFRDSDDDGRLDSVAVFQVYDFPEEGLQFQPIEPIPYHYVQAERAGEGGFSEMGLGLGWDRAGDSGRLRFFAQALGIAFRAEIDPAVEVDPASLPATIEVAGAQLTVTAWDGRRPTVRVDRPFRSGTVRLVQGSGAGDAAVTLAIIGGTGHHWHIEYYEAALPGAPPAPPAR